MTETVKADDHELTAKQSLDKMIRDVKQMRHDVCVMLLIVVGSVLACLILLAALAVWE